MRQSKFKSFRRLIRELRQLCPTIVPVRVRRRALPNAEDALGYSTLIFDRDNKASHFIIIIDSDISWDAVWQILLHEWAHCLAWTEDHPTFDDHGPEWGIQLARCYQAVIAA